MKIKRLCDEFTVSERAREIEQVVHLEMARKDVHPVSINK